MTNRSPSFSHRPIKKRTKVDLTELLPEIAIRSWTYGSGRRVELLFEIYRWLIQSAGQTMGRKGVNRYEGLAKRLNQHVDCLHNGDNSFHSDTWREDLCQRILAAFRTKDAMQRQWLRDAKLDPPKTFILTNPIRDADITDAIKELFALESQHRHVRNAPSNRHPHATVVSQIKLSLDLVAGEWVWAVWYLCTDPTDDDRNDLHAGPATRQKPDELFADFILRARAELEAQFQPPCTTESAPIHLSLPCFVGFTGCDWDANREIIGGKDVKERASTIVLPDPIEGDAVAFLGESRAFARSTKGYDDNVPLMHATEDIWVLLPGGKKPSRLLVYRFPGGPIEYRTEGVTDRDTYGLFRSGNGGPIKLDDRTAREARARYLLTVDMYRRGFLHLSWKEHQARGVNAILNPHPNNSDYGISPKQKADADRFCREVRSVLWQHHGDMCPVIARTSCIAGTEEGWDGDGEVMVIDREDPPIADPATRADVVVQELHARAVWAKRSQADWQPGGIFVLGFDGDLSSFHTVTTKPVFFDVEQNNYPELGPKAIANDIIAREGLIVQMMFGDNGVRKKSKEMGDDEGQGPDGRTK
jgi:hypothetical protein